MRRSFFTQTSFINFEVLRFLIAYIKLTASLWTYFLQQRYLYSYALQTVVEFVIKKYFTFCIQIILISCVYCSHELNFKKL